MMSGTVFRAPIARGFFLSMAFMVVTCIGGCQSDGETPVSTIIGTVTYQGKPVTGGTLTFEMTTENGTVPNSSLIESDGQYEVTYAIPGQALISVETATQEGQPGYFPLPERFANPSTSGLKYQIQKGTQQYDIVIE